VRSSRDHHSHPMPYGATELLDGAGARWLRAMLSGAIAWAAVFTLLGLTGALDRPPGSTIEVACCTDLPHVAENYEPILETASGTPGRVRTDEGAFEPVDDTVALEAALFEGAELTGATDEGTTGSGGRSEGDFGGESAGGIGIHPPEEQPPFEEHEVDEAPVAITIVEPRYPELAREAGVEGTVLVRALVSRSGRIERVEIVRSSPMFDDTAREALARWVFKPAWHQGRPVSVWVAIPVRFRLR
jgi:TonB family protein